MNYLIIGLSAIVFIFGIVNFIIRAMHTLDVLLISGYLLALRSLFFDLIYTGIILVVAYIIYAESKIPTPVGEYEPIQFSKFIKNLKNGLWLSLPTCGLSAAFIFADIQSFAIIAYIPLVIGLPWSFPGLFVMLGAGLGQGGDETLKLIVFYLGAAWVFISITINGAFILSYYQNKNSAEDID